MRKYLTVLIHHRGVKNDNRTRLLRNDWTGRPWLHNLRLVSHIEQQAVRAVVDDSNSDLLLRAEAPCDQPPDQTAVDNWILVPSWFFVHKIMHFILELGCGVEI